MIRSLLFGILIATPSIAVEGYPQRSSPAKRCLEHPDTVRIDDESKFIAVVVYYNSVKKCSGMLDRIQNLKSQNGIKATVEFLVFHESPEKMKTRAQPNCEVSEPTIEVSDGDTARVYIMCIPETG